PWGVQVMLILLVSERSIKIPFEILISRSPKTGRTLEVQVESDAAIPVLKNPLVIPIDRSRDERPEIDDGPVLDPPEVAQILVRSANIGPLDKPERCLEIR